MSQYVVIGTSPFADTSVASGPFRSIERAGRVDTEMTFRGWNTEVCELVAESEIPWVTNDEGVD